MSLLMDALKKAEQEKRVAAERLKDMQKKQPQEGTQQSMEAIATSLVQSREEVAPFAKDQDKLDVTSKMEGLALPPAEDQTKNQPLIVKNMESEDCSVQDLSLAETSLSGSLSFVEENDNIPTDDEFELEINKSPIAPAEDTIQAAKMFDDTETITSGIDEYEYFSSTVSSAQLAEDFGADSPTPVTAQTVFMARPTRSGNQILQWGTFALLCLVIAVSLPFFIYNYTVPVERTIKPPLIAKDIETQSGSMPAIEIPNTLIPDVELNSNLFTSEIADVIKKENGTVTEDQENSVAESVAANESEQEVTAGHFVSTADELPKEIWYPSDNNFSEEYASENAVVGELALPLPEKITLGPELIKISRRKSVDKSSALVNRAYEEYLAGNYDSAEKNYHNVLKDLPENRDALLGLATISLHKNDIRQAYSNYIEVLKLYPGDSVAEAALINFKSNGDYSKNESILKTFLQKEPDNSFLHYSLARLYATHTRWSEAQQSFFDAYKIESSNADYAFNLAVSLEHIGQQQSAIDYYNVALELADNSAVNFDSSVVIARINALSNQANLR